MKQLIIALAATAILGSCANHDEKTAAASKEEAAKTVVVEKKVYVPVETKTVAEPQKKGWSKAAKGTAIGAGTGAIVGAVVSKKKGTGAIIGAVVGGGSGYLIGRDKDRKDGRVKPKN